MKGGMRAGAMLAIGYFLGRQHKLRTAVLLAAAAAGSGMPGGNDVLQRGMKMAGSTEAIGKIAPQLTEIVDTVRGDLLDAVKAAAAAAVTSQLDSLTGSLHERADRLRTVGEGTVEDVGEAAGQAADTGRAAADAGHRAASGAAGRATSTVGGAARRATGRGRPAARDEEEEYEPEDYEAEEPEAEAGEAEDYEAEPEEYEPVKGEDEEAGGVHDEEPSEVPAQRTAPRRRPPVTRARR
jgi:hypothetical protein